MPMAHQQSTLNFVPQSTNLVNKSNQNFYNHQSTQFPYSTQRSSGSSNVPPSYNPDRPVIHYLPVNQSTSSTGSVTMVQNYAAHQQYGVMNSGQSGVPNCPVRQQIPPNQAYIPTINARPVVALPPSGGCYSRQAVPANSKNVDRIHRTVILQ